MLIQNILSLVIVLLLCGVGYYSYREWGVHEAMAKPSLVNTISIPPVICKGSASGFRAYSGTRAYYAHGAFRADAVSFDLGTSSLDHLIVTPDKQLYLWSDGSTRGTTFNIAASATNSDNSRSNVDILAKLNVDLSVFESGSCAIWWDPDLSLFEPPFGVQFNAIDQRQ